ncbi:MAG: malonyl-CoA decarboxylase N-terminal domain-containing protein, partial [Acidobacteriota bacterium]
MKKPVRQAAELARRAASSDGADRALIERFRRQYEELSPDHRLEFFRWLAGEFEIAFGAIDGPMEVVRDTPEDDRPAWNANVRQLRKAIASPRQSLFEGLINTTGGMEFVFDLRAEVLDLQRGGEPGLEALEEDIAHLLNRWCQHGL